MENDVYRWNDLRCTDTEPYVCSRPCNTLSDPVILSCEDGANVELTVFTEIRLLLADAEMFCSELDPPAILSSNHRIDLPQGAFVCSRNCSESTLTPTESPSQQPIPADSESSSDQKLDTIAVIMFAVGLMMFAIAAMLLV